MLLKVPTFRFNFSYFLLLLFVSLQGISQTFDRVDDIIGFGGLANNNGVAVADYDGDNDLDVFVVAGAVEDDADQSSFSRLFRNNNDGSFTDVTEASGLVNLLTLDDITQPSGAQQGYKYGVSWGDINNDGYPDIIFTYSLKIQLFLNLGNGTFEDITTSSGLPLSNACVNTGATWFDYNNDGFLDVYFNDWNNCDSNSFYRNNGDNTFTNVTIDLGLTETESYFSYTAFPFDVNSDGWMDIIVSNDFDAPNYLYINQLGQSFTEEAENYGLNSMINDMAITISDFDLDGDFDFFHGGIDENSLLENIGSNNFSETSAEHNITETGWVWGTKFSDFDLDGDEDLFITNGFFWPSYGPDNNVYYTNLHSQGQPAFQDDSELLGVDAYTESVEALDFDYDNDGDMDLIVTDGDGPIIFYENRLLNFDDEIATLNWFKIKLEGTVSNRDAIGTTIAVTTASGTIQRYYSGVGFLSQSLQGAHFGLNDETQINELQISWPSGIVETYNDLEANITIKATEGQGIEILDIQPSEKIYGCTDPESCNYDPAATFDDGSCSYLESQPISGNTEAAFLSTETYSYNIGENSSAIWQVTGGELLSGQGTNTITVHWAIEDFGHISVVETNDQCSSVESSMEVTLSAENLSENISIARLWNEVLLESIRGDFARPTMHARNLFHSSIAMYDIWAIYDEDASPYLIGNDVHGFSSTLESFTPIDSREESLREAISYAMYRLLTHRFQASPTQESTQAMFDLVMDRLGYDTDETSVDYSSGNAAAFGNYVAQIVISYGLQDGSREASGYDNAYYEPVNIPYALDSDENQPINDPNRWQPLGLETFVDQGGNIVGDNIPPFLSPEWGNVNGFALSDEDKITYQRDGNNYHVFHDPLDPPYVSLTESNENSDNYKWGFSMVSVWQSHLDPSDGVMWDISPNAIGNVDISTFPTDYNEYPNFYDFFEGGSNSNGHSINPITGNPYETNIVPRGDYARVLAEFWADGPDSETPPGHWFDILNYVNDHPQFEARFAGEGQLLDPLEWNVKSYFILGGGMHDAAISAWSVKGWYDYIRPISAIRSMAERGQSTNEALDNYDISGIQLIDDFIEVVEEGDELAGANNEHVGKIKLYTWKGHDFIDDTEIDQAGVGWILAEDWWPYQRPTFVTPPFAGYVSGHSTFSRTAAELMTMMTGSEYFPGGLGEFVAKANEFLVFEEGPSVDVVLQWATYRDASDQTSLSRIWGGIHPPADDIPGRFIGQQVAEDVFSFAVPYFEGTVGLEEHSQEVIIYPNPTTNREIFIVNTNANDIVEVFDIQGRIINVASKMYDETSLTTTIKFNEFIASGIYLLKVNDLSKIIVIDD